MAHGRQIYGTEKPAGINSLTNAETNQFKFFLNCENMFEEDRNPLFNKNICVMRNYSLLYLFLQV